MQLIIDIDEQEVVQNFGTLQPTAPIECKSQDTPKLDIYFSEEGQNVDLGSAPGLRFGVFDPTGTNPNPLVETSTFTRTVDTNGLICYVGYPNFNTTQLAAMIGSAQEYTAVGEVRYQTNGAIERTMDIPYSIIRSLLAETVLDTTQAAFTVPAVASNVTIQITDTNWLAPGKNLFIGGGAGDYQVVSITDSTHFVAENQGGASNAAPATVIPAGTTVGNASTSTLPTYPDPSIVEVTTHKDQASGYAGLDASLLLKGSEIPVDGTTIALNGSGQLEALVVGSPGQNAFTEVTAPFTTPAAGDQVTIKVGSTSWMGGHGYVLYIQTAGYYAVSVVVDSLTVTVTNLGYANTNAASGVTIPVNSTVSPGALIGPAGNDGADGAPGANAYDVTTANFLVPAVDATVNITINNTGWLNVGQEVFIGAGAGYYSVQTLVSVTVFTAVNSGYTANAAPGTTINSGTHIVPTGLQGPTGPSGSGSGDMLKSVYDTNNNGVVDTCDALAWGKLTGVPVTFPPSLSDSETTAGVTLLGSGVGQINRLIAGANVTLDTSTTPGGVIINGAAAGGGGGITDAPNDGQTYGRKLAAWVAIPPLSDAETTSGQSLLGSTAGSIKRLIAGTNVTLDTSTTPGGVIVNASGSGGGGGGMLDRTTAVELFDDCTSFIQSGTPYPPFGSLGWTWVHPVGSGNGTIAAQPNGSTGVPEIGIWNINPCTTGTISLDALTLGPTGTNQNIAAPAVGAMYLEWRVKLPALENATNYNDWRIGFVSNIAAANWIGAWFNYNVNNSPNWYCYAWGGNGTLQSGNSGTAVGTTYVKLGVAMNAAWTTATFTINGTAVATLSTLSWAAGNAWTPVIATGLRAGSQLTNMYVDWFYLKYTVSR